MTKFDFERTDVDGLMLIQSFFSDDDRGYFLKSYETDIFEKNGIIGALSEDFESFSQHGVVRGLHFQTEKPQAKLVRVLSGRIYDVAVDLRKKSTTYGQWRGFYLSGEERKSLFIPQGFAHGFMVVSENALVSYKCIGKYIPDADSGILWNDETLNIHWPIDGLKESVVVSARDSSLMSFRDYNKSVNSL